MRFRDVFLVFSVALNVIFVALIVAVFKTPDIFVSLVERKNPAPGPVITETQSADLLNDEAPEPDEIEPKFAGSEPVVETDAGNETGSVKEKYTYSSRTINNGDSIKKVYHSVRDVKKAFAEDELFAVTGKKVIQGKRYTDHFDKNAFGNPTEKTLPPVYLLICLGRETREHYLFIVPRTDYETTKVYQKFSKAQVSKYEAFLSEERLENEIYHRRFRAKMID